MNDPGYDGSALDDLSATPVAPTPAPEAPTLPVAARLRRRQRGQALPLMALALVVLLGFTGLALDVSMLLLRTLQQQRAADAAALAGVVQLPDYTANAIRVARDYAGRNGYIHDTNGGYPQVTVIKVANYNTRIKVTINALHDVYFMRIFGIDTVPIERTAEAIYAKPIRLGCNKCVTFGVGNQNPKLVHDADPQNQCKGCVLTTDRITNFWAAISGPGSKYDSGDEYNSKYLADGGWDGSCPGIIGVGTGNVDYVPRSPANKGAGYSYGLYVEPNNSPLKIYVYDPAQYYRPLSSGNTDPDTLDSQPCYIGPGSDPTRYRFRTYYTIYRPDQTPDDFTDDVVYSETSFIDTNDPAKHNHWFELATLDPGLLGQGLGDYRLQVTTDDELTPGVYGAGNNQYALALGGDRTPTNSETIYAFKRMSILNNIRNVPVGTSLTFDLAQIPKENAGDRLTIRMFDPGDFSCNSYVQLLGPDGTVQNFKQDWILDTDRIDTTTCATLPCLRPYNGRWTSMGVQLPPTYNGGWWSIKYTVGGCRTNPFTADRTVWEILLIGNPIHLVP